MICLDCMQITSNGSAVVSHSAHCYYDIITRGLSSGVLLPLSHSSLNSIGYRAEEMAPWVKQLLGKHKDLSSYPKHLCENQG